MICPDMEKLMAWMDGELPKDEAASVEEHLAICSTCRSIIESQRHIEKTWRESYTAPSKSQFSRFEKQLTGQLFRKNWLRTALPVAAAFVAVLLGVKIFLIDGSQRRITDRITDVPSPAVMDRDEAGNQEKFDEWAEGEETLIEAEQSLSTAFQAAEEEETFFRDDSPEPDNVFETDRMEETPVAPEVLLSEDMAYPQTAVPTEQTLEGAGLDHLVEGEVDTTGLSSTGSVTGGSGGGDNVTVLSSDEVPASAGGVAGRGSAEAAIDDEADHSNGAFGVTVSEETVSAELGYCADGSLESAGESIEYSGEISDTRSPEKTEEITMENELREEIFYAGVTGQHAESESEANRRYRSDIERNLQYMEHEIQREWTDKSASVSIELPATVFISFSVSPGGLVFDITIIVPEDSILSEFVPEIEEMVNSLRFKAVAADSFERVDLEVVLY